MKLTAQQKRHLDEVAANPGRGSYPGLLRGTLNSLEKRGLVKADRSNPGCFYSPCTAIRWTITAAGQTERAKT